MNSLCLFLLSCHVSSAVKHSLKYFITASSGISDFPEFVGAALVDGVLVGYCDSSIRRAEPKLDWMKELIKKDPQHLEWYTQKCSGNQQVFRANINSLKKRLNQTEGVHIFQRMNGCEWDDETDKITGFNQYGYDGEDFIALDLQTLTWIAPKPQAVVTKLQWDTEKPRLEHNKNYYINRCPDWLKKYVKYGRSFLQRSVLPSVSLLQRTPSSLVSCHATGFYPERAMMFWRRGEEEIHEGVEHGEILPNHDGSFQMSVELNISSIKPEDWRRYDCVFQLYDGKEDIITKLDKTAIRTNWVSPSVFPVGPVVGGVGGPLLLLAVFGFFIWRRNNNGFQLTNTGEQ
ncbi:major histocompatibility complex class I-related gene protein-like [Neolamprologus brichardi]|uniref:major histocompatibility complex class I-related gene protein-like n=1 Tax=Neolamprologus brichardi TaxID=32507 RepID=UPI0003EC0036|nr:major histocompatibility complex class I-related gene protein-like [Neolamprologus brichardi]